MLRWDGHTLRRPNTAACRAAQYVIHLAPDPPPHALATCDREEVGAALKALEKAWDSVPCSCAGPAECDSLSNGPGPPTPHDSVTVLGQCRALAH